jgi:hypothetical protein
MFGYGSDFTKCFLDFQFFLVDFKFNDNIKQMKKKFGRGVCSRMRAGPVVG